MMNNKKTIRVEVIYPNLKRMEKEKVSQLVEIEAFAKLGYELFENKDELPIKINDSKMGELHNRKTIELTLTKREDSRKNECGCKVEGNEFISLNTKVKFQKNKIRELEGSLSEKDLEIKKLKGLLAQALMEKDLCENLLETIFETLSELEEEAMKEMPKEQVEKIKKDEEELMNFFKSLRRK